MAKGKTKFIIGNLYHNRYPYDLDENYPYYDMSQNSWYKIVDDEEKMSGIFVYLGKSSVAGASRGWGVFLFGSKKLVIKLDDLSEYIERGNKL